ncbi:YqaJ-like viral recombinase domain protein [Eubacteriaceae bacterium CHKCI005]|nr:YqaJ-like viral recombinase domain protein [Eubacteriaceae bacterium CHKCI005]
MGKITRISTSNMSHTDWLEERKKAVGGSDASAVLGLNPYVTPYTLWANKTGRLPDLDDNEAMRQDRDLEPYVVQRFEEVSGKRCRRIHAILRNSDYPWASANIDRAVIGESAGLECKTTNVLNLRKFQGGEFLDIYYCQCVHYLSVTQWQRCYLAVLDSPPAVLKWLSKWPVLPIPMVRWVLLATFWASATWRSALLIPPPRLLQPVALMPPV